MAVKTKNPNRVAAGKRHWMTTRHKFSAVPTVHDGIRFDSKAEGRYYEALKLRQAAGEVLFFLRQVPIDLPGGVKYRLDFLVFTSSGEVEFVDVKGMKTPVYKIKKRQVEATYPIKIKEVK